MLDEACSRRILHEAFPEIDIRALTYFASGWDYEMWEVNGELLFRFPQREDCGKPLAKEVRLLAELADTLSAPVPRPKYFSHGCEAFQLPFFGYRKLAGTPLSEAELSGPKRASMARQLGRLLSELHRFPQERATELGVPTYSTEGWAQLYSELRETCGRDVSPLLSREERTMLTSNLFRHLHRSTGSGRLSTKRHRYTTCVMLDDARCRRILREAFPELDVRALTYFASGWDYEMWASRSILRGALRTCRSAGRSTLSLG